MNISRKVIFFYLLMILLTRSAYSGLAANVEKIGQFYPGMSLNDVRKILGTEDNCDKDNIGAPWLVSYDDRWTFIVNPKTLIVDQISYGFQGPSKLSTLKGIAVGDNENDIVAQYGQPSVTLSMNTELMLKNSPLQKYFFYDDYNLAFFIENNDINNEKWKIGAIIACTPEGYQSLVRGAPTYSRKYLTDQLKEEIINAYDPEKQDLYIYDDYMLERMKLTPQEDIFSFDLLDENTKTTISNKAKQIVTDKFDLKAEDLEKILKKVEDFRRKNYHNLYK